jgi:hypothetical protein
VSEYISLFYRRVLRVLEEVREHAQEDRAVSSATILSRGSAEYQYSKPTNTREKVDVIGAKGRCNANRQFGLFASIRQDKTFTTPCRFDKNIYHFSITVLKQDKTFIIPFPALI